MKMQDISNKLFLCYAWEDAAEVKEFVKELEYELNAKVSTAMQDGNDNTYNEEKERKIEETAFLVLFISDAARNSDYVAECVRYAQNINRNILPIVIEKKKLFTSAGDKFNLRSKPYSITDEKSKEKLFGQFKALLGQTVEAGDEYGTLVHIVIEERNAKVRRYGEELGTAYAGKDCKIRLAKGKHLLEFIDIETPEVRCSVEYEVNGKDKEQFLKVNLIDLYKENERERQRQQKEEELNKKIEDEAYQKRLELYQKQMEIEHQQQLAQIEEQKRLEEQRRREEERQTTYEDREKPSGCLITVIVVLGIAMPGTLLISLPYLYFKYYKK